MAARTVRLQSVEITGFRAFGGTHRFDLSADVVVVHGPNGSGKTSMLDAVLWAITGAVARLGDAADIVSEYSDFGEAHVKLVLVAPDGVEVRISRRQERGAKHSPVTVETADERHSGSIAESRLMEMLWPEGLSSEDPAKSLARSFTRAVYLQQDQVRSFIQDEDEKGRFDIVGEIVGMGRVGELIRKLEGSRKAWTTATNQFSQRELEPLVQRRSSLLTAIADARAGAPDPALDARWSAWQSATSAALGVAQPEGTRRQILEATLSHLSNATVAVELRRTRLGELKSLIAALPENVAGIEEAEERVRRADALTAECEAQLAAANERAAVVRQQLVELASERDSLAAMARLAMDHLADECPVCQQPHDVSATEAHLRSLVAAASAPLAEPDTGVPEASQALRDAEAERSRARAELNGLQRARQDRAARIDQIRGSAESLGLAADPSDASLDVDGVVAQLEGEIDAVAALRREGEQLSAAIAVLDEGRRADELAGQLPGVEADIAEKEALIALREDAGEDAKLLHESLRDLSESLVASELAAIEPLLQRIYASVDPHPTFRAVKFLSDTHRGRGRLWTSVEDETNEKSVSNPNTVLSSSQLNVLAVVTFMAMNLSAHTLPLQVAALDDPLQSLDNVNLLGLADLLRRTRQARQVVLSTHDDRLVGLLERKLRPVGPTQRTTIIHMDGWQPAGPVVTVRDLPVDNGERRLLRSVS